MAQVNNRRDSMNFNSLRNIEGDNLISAKSEHPLCTLSFGVFGFVLQIFFSIGIAASQDILEETLVPTPVLLVSASMPFFIITSILPHFIQKLPRKLPLVPIVVLNTLGVLLYALIEDVVVRVVGVVVVSCGVAIGEVTFVSLTALYSDAVMSAYAAGTGVGFIAGPLYYAVMTTALCVSPETTVLIIAGVPLVLPLFYAILTKKDCRQTQGIKTHKEVPYMPLKEATEKENDLACSEKEMQEHLTCSEKEKLIMENLFLAIAFFVGYFSEFLTLNGVVTTLAFPSSPFDPRSHFVYYACVFMIGECIGRSYISLCIFLKAKCALVIKQTWILSGVLSILLVFLTFASWYRFLPSVWIVMFLVFIVGLLAGSLYLNTYLVASEKGDQTGKAFSRAFLSVGPSTGVLVAGLVGLVLEPALREHCLRTVDISDYCFTRSMGGWNETTSCLRL